MILVSIAICTEESVAKLDQELVFTRKMPALISVVCINDKILEYVCNTPCFYLDS